MKSFRKNPHGHSEGVLTVDFGHVPRGRTKPPGTTGLQPHEPCMKNPPLLYPGTVHFQVLAAINPTY